MSSLSKSRQVGAPLFVGRLVRTKGGRWCGGTGANGFGGKCGFGPCGWSGRCGRLGRCGGGPGGLRMGVHDEHCVSCQNVRPLVVKCSRMFLAETTKSAKAAR